MAASMWHVSPYIGNHLLHAAPVCMQCPYIYHIKSMLMLSHCWTSNETKLSPSMSRRVMRFESKVKQTSSVTPTPAPMVIHYSSTQERLITKLNQPAQVWITGIHDWTCIVYCTRAVLIGRDNSIYIYICI